MGFTRYYGESVDVFIRIKDVYKKNVYINRDNVFISFNN